MPFDTCPDLLVDDSPAARRTSAALVALAALGLVGSLLVSSPPRFSPQHLSDHSLLRGVVDGLALWDSFPTIKGIEIRDVFFHLAAAALAFVAAIRLTSASARPRMSFDDLLSIRQRAANPIAWWIFFIFCSALTSSFSNSPRLTLGHTALHVFQLAWWLPLAALLTPHDARSLARVALTILGVLAALGLWYYFQRVYPRVGFDARLSYPLGNELWMAACLLPAPFLAFGLIAARLRRAPHLSATPAATVDASAVAAEMPTQEPGSSSPAEADQPAPASADRPGLPLPIACALLGLSAALAIAAIALTRSRSAAIGAAAGILTLVMFLSTPSTRRVVAGLALIAVLAGGFWLLQQRNAPDSALRVHSMRARLDYEWPYAIRLWWAKRILGHGDGAYGLLAGQFARTDQLDDPNVMGFNNETSWVEHADCEPLQLLADVGAVGAIAFLGAIAATLWIALRYCDEVHATADATDSRSAARIANRFLVAALAAALVALFAEECSANGLRQPGLPAVFLTIWAILWAVVRRHRPMPQNAIEAKWFGNVSLRTTGIVATAMAVGLAILSLADGRAARARFKADTALTAGRCDEAILQADRASPWSLDGLEQLRARLMSAWAMSLDFDRRLKLDAAPSDGDLAVATTALSRLATINYDAPRFLRVASLRAELYTNLARACRRRDELSRAFDYEHKRNLALATRIADEPFRFESVQAAWVAFPDAPSPDRLTWLRGLLRAGEIDPRVVQLFVAQGRAADLVPSLNDMLNIANSDEARPPDQWSDRLSPETFRLGALAMDLQGRPADAAQLAAHARNMYAAAGARLFSAHAATLHELVRYRFAVDPGHDFDKRLQELADAHAQLGAATSPSDPLPTPMGDTRLSLLVAAGREADARVQISKLAPDANIEDMFARSYQTLAAGFAATPDLLPQCLAWSRRAVAIAPQSPDAHATLARLLLQSGDANAALASLETLKKLVPADTFAQLVEQLRLKYPEARIWPQFASPTTSRASESDRDE